MMMALNFKLESLVGDLVVPMSNFQEFIQGFRRTKVGLRVGYVACRTNRQTIVPVAGIVPLDGMTMMVHRMIVIGMGRITIVKNMAVTSSIKTKEKQLAKPAVLVAVARN